MVYVVTPIILAISLISPLLVEDLQYIIVTMPFKMLSYYFRIVSFKNF